MDIDHQRKTVAILKVLNTAGRPMGSAAISLRLGDWGIDLGERMVRYYLGLTDQAGLTKNLRRRGRIITDLGRKELEVGIAIDKVGFVAARVDELSYRMTFDETTLQGTVILNISLINRDCFPDALKEISTVMQARLGMGRLLLIGSPGSTIENTSIRVPNTQIAIGTVCSVTLNGVLLRHGITMTSRFGGLLELHHSTPVRFRQIINYDGSTLDPLEIFIKGKMTSVRQTALTGTGVIGAGFREIPTIALPAAQKIVTALERIGLGGVLIIGKPSQPLLDIPVSAGRVGLIVAGGLNPVSALEELGLTTENHALHSLCNFSQLQSFDTLSI